MRFPTGLNQEKPMVIESHAHHYSVTNPKCYLPCGWAHCSTRAYGKVHQLPQQNTTSYFQVDPGSSFNQRETQD